MAVKHQPTDVAGSKVCYSTRWFDLRSTSAGVEGQEHYFISTHDYVSVVPLLGNDRVVLVRQFRPAVGQVTLEFPAGHVDPGQTPAQAAAAELEEEVGYRAGTLEQLGCIHPDTGRLGNRHWVFFARDLEPVQRQAQDPAIDRQIITLAEFAELIRGGQFNHAQHLASLQLATFHGKIALPAPSPAAVVAATARPRRHFRIDPSAQADVCVVGGGGHVGLPLSLVLAKAGMRVLIYDQNEAVLQAVAAGRMPFMEHGAQELLDDALKHKRLSFTSRPDPARGVAYQIVTIGTPVDEYLNPNTRAIRRWVDGFLPYIADNQLIMLRSTLYPGTTSWLDGHLRSLGRNVRVAFCPERIVQGQAIVELPKLPQIVAGTTPEAEEAAVEFWEMISPQIVRLSPIEAEFAKLFCNAYRYIQFAVANQLFTITSEAGVNFNRIVKGMKEHYPRMRDFPSAGFAAGPCLFKDTMQLAAFAQNRFTLGHAAMQINEGLVLWLSNELNRAFPLHDCTVGLLGMAFKPDIDDTRSSLSYKLKKALQFRCREVLTTDPYVTGDLELRPLEEVIERSDVLIMCTPHRQWQKLDVRGKPLIDVWGFTGLETGLPNGSACGQ